ncbi:hypothetical protein GOP47_0030495 [Adiantum capillus-veneris]|nr:hypothetical protein GOP47_0030495 [Adiantum capillus-veneris]
MAKRKSNMATGTNKKGRGGGGNGGNTRGSTSSSTATIATIANTPKLTILMSSPPSIIAALLSAYNTSPPHQLPSNCLLHKSKFTKMRHLCNTEEISVGSFPIADKTITFRPLSVEIFDCKISVLRPQLHELHPNIPKMQRYRGFQAKATILPHRTPSTKYGTLVAYLNASVTPALT